MESAVSSVDAALQLARFGRKRSDTEALPPREPASPVLRTPQSGLPSPCAAPSSIVTPAAVAGTTRRMPPLIQLTDIHLTFGGKPLLGGVELSVSAGERVCLVGRNGS